MVFNDRHPNEEKTSRSESGKAIVGDNVMIVSNPTIFPNVEISDNVVIGAGPLVAKSICESGTYFGNPLKKKKE